MPQLTFIWWNVQRFAHFDLSRAGENGWPRSEQAYLAKRRGVGSVLNALVRKEGSPGLVCLGEITRRAALDLCSDCLPGHAVYSLDLQERPQLQVAVLYSRDYRVVEREPLVVPFMPRGTRPMGVVDVFSGGHQLRFYVCHWTARFEPESTHRRADIAAHLNRQVFDFLNENGDSQQRHVVIVGDMNEEPFGILEDRLYAYRSRRTATRVPHYTDGDMKRQRLYNCAWRLLGECRPHNGSIGNHSTGSAGTYYWQKKRRWYTMDHIIVDGSLLTDRCPYLDESTVKVINAPEVSGRDGLPLRFEWQNEEAIGGVSDHLPISATIILERD